VTSLLVGAAAGLIVFGLGLVVGYAITRAAIDDCIRVAEEADR
jgi:hypothetical protein